MRGTAVDAVVIGAGPNGLATAGLLAAAGRKVVVVEGRASAGGLARGEECHPGFTSPGLLHDSTRVRESVVAALDLEKHGLRRRSARPGHLALGAPGEGLWIDGDPAAAARSISALSPRDGAAWLDYHAKPAPIRALLADFLTTPPVNIIDPESMGFAELVRRALKVRSLGREEMLELMRVPPLGVADWLGEWFEGDLIKATLALPAIAGNWMGPRSPGGAANLLIHEALAGAGVEGDGPALVAALESAARSRGVQILGSARVTRILVDGGETRGVAIEDGREIRARVVAASCDPRRLILDLLPLGAAGERLTRRIECYRMRGSTAQVLLALEGDLRFRAHPGEAVERARTGARLDDLERAFDPIKYRRLPERPILEIYSPRGPAPSRGSMTPGESAAADPGARPALMRLSPEGASVVSILVHFVPHELEGGWTDEAREGLGDRVVALLEEHAPGTRSRILARKVLAPPDIERGYGVTGGHVHHGEMALDQILIRPVPECHAHATPLKGLYLCGMGAHPGGGLTLAPAELASRAILAENS